MYLFVVTFLVYLLFWPYICPYIFKLNCNKFKFRLYGNVRTSTFRFSFQFLCAVWASPLILYMINLHDYTRTLHKQSMGYIGIMSVSPTFVRASRSSNFTQMSSRYVIKWTQGHLVKVTGVKMLKIFVWSVTLYGETLETHTWLKGPDGMS